MLVSEAAPSSPDGARSRIIYDVYDYRSHIIQANNEIFVRVNINLSNGDLLLRQNNLVGDSKYDVSHRKAQVLE